MTPKMHLLSQMSFYIGLNQKTTYLSQIVDLSGYEVATVDCYLPTHIVAGGNNFKVYVSTNAGVSYDKCITIQIPPFETWTMTVLDKVITELSSYVFIDLEDGYIQAKTLSEKVNVKLPESLKNILGLNSNIITNMPVHGATVVSFDILYDRIIVACNAVPSYQMNGTFLPCIYVGKPKQKYCQPFYVCTQPGQFFSIVLSFLMYLVSYSILQMVHSRYYCILRKKP